MKKFIMVLAALVVFASFGTDAFATVGGPTYIGNFKYNPADESVYYILRSDSGRGCPPILQKISLATEKIETAYSCEDGEKLYYESNTGSINEINKITQNFKDLTPINLTDNKIQIDLNFVTAETFGEENSIAKRNFTATVYQNGQKIDQFAIPGCTLDQPFTFAGYAIPGFEKKIALLSSGTGDCFEGGYTTENLFVIGGLQSLNRASSYNTLKMYNSPLIPSVLTQVVFEKDKITPTSSAITTSPMTTDEPIDPKLLMIIGGFVIALIVGVVLGRVTKTI